MAQLALTLDSFFSYQRGILLLYRRSRAHHYEPVSGTQWMTYVSREHKAFPIHITQPTGGIPHPYSSYRRVEAQRNVNTGQERLPTLKSVMEKNEILSPPHPPAPAPHPKSQGTRKPRAALYNAGKLTTKIRHCFNIPL